MTAIEPLGIDTVQLLHAAREIGQGRLDKEVVAVAHQAISMADPAKSLDRVGENIEETLSICIIEKDLSPGVLKELQGTRSASSRFLTVGSHMVQRTLVFNSQWSSHGSSIAN